MGVPTLLGIYRGVVESVADPLGNGRFAVRLFQAPTVETAKLLWVTYTSPMGGITPGLGAGFFMPPRKKSVVEIAFENGDPQSPIYICTVYGPDRKTNSNSIPIEAVDIYQDAINRVIKTDAGHIIELDDRERTVTGIPTSGVRIKTGLGKSLELGDGSGKVELNSGSLGHLLRMQASEVVLKSRAGQGLFVNDDETTGAGVWLRPYHPDDTGIVLNKGSAYFGMSNEVKLQSKVLSFSSLSQFNVKTSALELRSSASTKISSGGSFLNSVLGKWILSSVGGVEILLAGGDPTLPSNFIIKSPIPGIPLVSGFFHADFAPPATFCFRIGAPIPGPTPPGFMPSTPDLGDVTATSRLVLGGSTGGAVALEGTLGGIYISPIPIPAPGTNAVVPLKKPTPYIPVPTQHEPMVKGTSFLIWLNTFIAWLNATLSGLNVLATTPGGFGLAGGFMPVTAPGVSALLTTQIATLNSTILPQLAAPHPQGFLSQICFTQ